MSKWQDLRDFMAEPKDLDAETPLCRTCAQPLAGFRLHQGLEEEGFCSERCRAPHEKYLVEQLAEVQAPGDPEPRDPGTPDDWLVTPMFSTVGSRRGRLLFTSHVWRKWNGFGTTGIEFEIKAIPDSVAFTCRVWQHGKVVHEEWVDHLQTVSRAKHYAKTLHRTLTAARLVVEVDCVTRVSPREYTIPVYWRQDLDLIIEDNTEEDEDDKLPGSESHHIIEVWRKEKS